MIDGEEGHEFVEEGVAVLRLAGEFDLLPHLTPRDITASIDAALTGFPPGREMVTGNPERVTFWTNRLAGRA